MTTDYTILPYVLGAVIIGLILYAYSLNSRLKMLEQILNCIKCDNYSIRPRKRWGLFLNKTTETIYHVLIHLNERNRLLQEQKLYQERLLDSMDTALLVADGEGNIQWCNPAAGKRLLGHDPIHLKQLSQLSPDLPEQLSALLPGEVKPLRFDREGDLYEMAASISRYQTRDKELRIISLSNIRRLLTENEVQTTHRLMRILTHEMMNSLTPIISLSSALESCMQQADCDQEELKRGLGIIRHRSEGLLTFVNNYRKLSKLSQPVMQEVCVARLLDTVRPLACTLHTMPEWPETDTPLAQTTLKMDLSQAEQVMLNLLKNADEACRQTPHPRIAVTLEMQKRYLLIHVNDNGTGIPASALERVFVPFYTTKKDGNGIGLALSRQIMLNHGGNITVQSTPGETTCFTLHFKRNV